MENRKRSQTSDTDNGSLIQPAPESPKIQTDVTPDVHRSLSLFHTVSLVVSSVGSSGIFIAMTTLLQYTKSVGLTLVLLAVSGLLNYSLAMCFTEVAILIPKAGGPYFFISELFGGFPAFLFMWGFIVMIITPVWALMAFTSALYITQLVFPGCRPPDVATKLLAVCILVLVVALNCMYMKYVTKVQSFLSSTKIIAMLIIVIGGIMGIAQGEVENFEEIFDGSTKNPGELALSVLAGMFIYGGWQIITFLLEEMKEPEKNLPRAVGISFIIVIVLNELTVAAYFVLISPKDMLNTDAVAVLFMERLYYPLAPVISVFVTTTSIGALNAVVLGHSRFIFAAARRRHMPGMFATLNDKYLMPWPATILLCVLSIIVLISGSLVVLIEMVSFYAVTMSVSVLLCLFALRIRRPTAPRPIRVWLGTAIFQFILNTSILLMSIYQKPKEMGLIVLILVCGIPLYIATVAWKSKPKSFNRFMDRLTILLQKLFVLKRM